MKIPFYFSDLPARAAIFRAAAGQIQFDYFVCFAVYGLYQREFITTPDYLAVEKYIQDAIKDAASVSERLELDGYFAEYFNWSSHCDTYRQQWCWAISRKIDGEPYETEYDSERSYE